MTRISLLVIALLSMSLTAYSQRTTYSIDNFDFRNGVSAPAPPAPTPVRSVKSWRKRDAARNLTSPASSQLITQTVWTPESSSLAATNVSALRGYTTGSAEVDAYLIRSGTNNGVDPLLLYSVMHQESSFKSHAISPKGARGLMQLMPGTAARYGVTNIFD